MKEIHAFLWIFLAGILFTCTTENPVILPTLPPPLTGVTAIPESSKAMMEGIYTVTVGADKFGDQVVLKWHGNNLSLFSVSNYFVMDAGYKNSTIYMQGYWRQPNSDGTGLTNFTISSVDGASSIINGIPTTAIQLVGRYGTESGTPTNDFVLKYARPFSATVTSKPFYIVGHRSGGRTSDRLPVSENSIEMIAYAENFGSTGIEIDIRLTKDNVPILYHDADINIRLTIKGPVNGDVTNFTWDQLSTYVRLIRGEKIRKLEDALNFAIDNTKLNFIWLDIKDTNPALINYVIPLQKKAIERAKAQGRQMEILFGIPTQEVYDALKATPGYQNIPSLCELSPEGARELNSRAWAPRWTLGTQNELVTQVQAEGRIALCWTIDVPSYIKQFIRDGKFNGLLTNYPSQVAYEHYIRQ